MAVSLRHTTLAVGTYTGSGELNTGQWNEEHTLTLGTGKVLGRASAGTGAVEELSMGTNITLTGGVIDLATPTVTLGGASANPPTAQTLAAQGASGSNVAGANFTIAGSQSTGSAAGGSILFKVSPAGGAGAAQNALATALTIDSTQKATFAATIQVANTATFDGAIVANNNINLLSTGSTFARLKPGSADGRLLLQDSTQALFNLIQLGGTTTSFPAIKRNGTAINIRLADDSADAPITCSYTKVNPVTVASLPAASTAGKGAIAYVTDATSTTARTTVAGTGANEVLVMSNGTNWLIVA